MLMPSGQKSSSQPMSSRRKLPAAVWLSTISDESSRMPLAPASTVPPLR